MKTGEMSILFDAMASLSNMKAPVFRNETVRASFIMFYIDLSVSIKNGTLRIHSREKNDKCKTKKVFYLGLKTKKIFVLF